MVNKEELSDKVNKFLSLDDTIDFSGMKKEDLERFVEFLSDPSKLIQAGLKRMRDRIRGEVLERPLKEFLDGLGTATESEEDKGPLGLGIIPRFRRVFRQPE